MQTPLLTQEHKHVEYPEWNKHQRRPYVSYTVCTNDSKYNYNQEWYVDNLRRVKRVNIVRYANTEKQIEINTRLVNRLIFYQPSIKQE